MPLRLHTPQSHAWRGRHVLTCLALGIAGLLAVHHFMTAVPHVQEVQAQAPAAPAALSSATPRGRWTIVYEHPETCAENCASVLDTLNAVSHDPASGVPDGVAQIVVRTAAQPARDLIVLDPEGQPAGFISHTTDPGRIVSGLATLRASQPPPTPIASR
jgi:hypothetical protein